MVMAALPDSCPRLIDERFTLSPLKANDDWTGCTGATAPKVLGADFVMPVAVPRLDAFSSAWNRSFDDSGRSSRGDDWWLIFANSIVGLV